LFISRLKTNPETNPMKLHVKFNPYIKSFTLFTQISSDCLEQVIALYSYWDLRVLIQAWISALEPSVVAVRVRTVPLKIRGKRSHEGSRKWKAMLQWNQFAPPKLKAWNCYEHVKNEKEGAGRSPCLPIALVVGRLPAYCKVQQIIFVF